MAANKKVVLVTGCSSGFGFYTAARLAKTHKVYATLRDTSKKKDLAAQAGESAANIQVRSMDVTDTAAMEKVMKEIEEKEGRLDVLVHNAGIAISGFFEDLSEEEMRLVMETNFFGVVQLTRLALPLLRKTQGSKLIIVSSAAGRVAIPFSSPYSASKWAVEGFAESIKYELDFHGVKVVLVEPGTYRTNIYLKGKFGKNIENPDSPYSHLTQQITTHYPKFLEKEVKNHPDDVAKLIEKITRNPNPKFRYAIGADGVLAIFLKRNLPFSLFAKLWNKLFFGSLGLKTSTAPRH